MIFITIRIDSFLYTYNGPLNEIFARWLDWMLTHFRSYHEIKVEHIQYGELAKLERD